MFIFSILITITLAMTVRDCPVQIYATIMLVHLLGLGEMYIFSTLITITLVLTVSGYSGQISTNIMLLAGWVPSSA